MRLRTKLALSFGFITLLGIVLGLSGMRTNSILSGHIDEIAGNRAPSVYSLMLISEAQTAVDAAENALLLSTTDAERNDVYKRVKDAWSRVDKGWKIYEPLPQTKEEEEVWKKFEVAWAKWKADHEKFMEMGRAYFKEPAPEKKEKLVHQALVENAKTFTPAEELLAKLVTLNVQYSDDESKKGYAAVASAKMVNIVLLAVCVLAAIGLAVYITGNVMAQLGEEPEYLRSISAQIAGGDLEVSFRELSKPRGVYEAMKAMVVSMKKMVLEANTKSEEAAEQARKAQIATGEANEAKAKAETAKAEGMLQAAGQLEGVVEVATSASQELSAQIEQSSRGAEEQSHRVAETATAMEEMNATVLEVAKNASRAAETSDLARAKAQEGEDIVEKVVAGIGQVQQQALAMKQDMGTLGKQAQDIGQILNVISDIADQTNLLALNAAIEAARAGEAGRGFAVVADEVRKLAEKTMTATKEVGDAIGGIQNGTNKNMDNVDRAVVAIEQATALANMSGNSLKEIVTLSDQTSDQVRSIATASEEQSSASEEINRSIEQVATISSETAQAMSEAARAVSEVARQTQVLQNLINDMKSENGAGPQALGAGAQRALR